MDHDSRGVYTLYPIHIRHTVGEIEHQECTYATATKLSADTLLESSHPHPELDFAYRARLQQLCILPVPVAAVA